jgi:hypothetical protein
VSKTSIDAYEALAGEYPDRAPDLPYTGTYPDGLPRTLDANTTEITTAADPRTPESVVNLRYLTDYIDTGGGGAIHSIADDPIWDAPGDLAVATGPDTAVRLPIGANGKVLGVAGGALGYVDPPPGATGPPGPQGPAGADSTVPGPTGPTGPQGPKGDTGATGSQGPIGNTGPQGPQGIKGDTGSQGPAGTTGAQGPAGPGVPVGGTAGQLLTKLSATDYATAWQNPATVDLSGYLPLTAGATKPLTGGLYFGAAADTGLYRSAAGVLKTDTTLVVGSNLFLLSDASQLYFGAAGDASFQRLAANFVGTAGDFGARLSQTGQITLQSSGGTPIIYFGSAQDTSLYRPAAGVLTTNGHLALDTGNTGQGQIRWYDPNSTTYGGIWRDNTSGTLFVRSQLNTALWMPSGNKIYFTPDGTTFDTSLYRSAAGVLRTDGEFELNPGAIGNRRLVVGAADSGGTGYRMVRVAN